MKSLLDNISNCRICESVLDHSPRPIVSVHSNCKILIIGQAPGIAVHKSGIPWDDQSGKNLRHWMGISKETFYNPHKIGIVPMGFCYPGKGKTGDLPPRKECAPQWHPSLFKELKQVELILLIGKYAQDYYLNLGPKRNLTETVKNFQEYLPTHLALPHPSPRNNIWMAKNPWFQKLVIPETQKIISQILN